MNKGRRYRIGIKIWNLGIKLKLHWMMQIGDKMKRKGMEDYV